MGATFAAVHVKERPAERLAKEMRRLLECDGYALLDEADPESDAERRVLIFEDSGWGVVADEELELSHQASDDLARLLSRVLESDVISISVFHSDEALLTRFRGGRRLGGFCVPKDGRLDRKTGHRLVAAKFLSSLAVSAEAKARLAHGLVADRTFPEQTIGEATRLIGLPHHQTGASHRWDSPPMGAIKLRFASPRIEIEEEAPLDWGPAEAEEHDVLLSTSGQTTFRVGEPFGDQITVTAQAFSGPRIDGLSVDLSGTALALLDVTELAGWNPADPCDNDANTVILTAHLDGPSNGRLRANFPEALLAPAPPVRCFGTSAAALRRFTLALAAAGQCQFFLRLGGAASAPGAGELRLRLLDRQGTPVDANELQIPVEVVPSPRMPITPRPVRTHGDAESQRHLIRAASDYGGGEFLCGWLGFDSTWPSLDDWMLDWASALGSVLARKAPLEVSLTSLGAHPEVAVRFGPEAHLARDKRFRVVPSTLASEGIAELHFPYGEDGGRASVAICHQPRGSTVLDAETRAQFKKRRRSVPLELTFAIARPMTPSERTAIGGLIDKLFVSASSRSDCVGGFAAPLGSAPWSEVYPYERIISTETFGHELEFVRHHARSPGWRVIIPHPALSGLAEQEGITRTQALAGALLRSSAVDPFEMSDADREAAERAVLGCIGQPER